MPYVKRAPNRSAAILIALALAAAMAHPILAEDPPASAPPDQPIPADALPVPGSQSQSAMVSLIDRLAQRGTLTKQDASDLRLMAEADAAEARASAALAQAAIAMANAAQARARAIEAQAAGLRRGVVSESAPADSPAEASQGPAETVAEAVPPPATKPSARTNAAVRRALVAAKPAVPPPPAEEAVPDDVVRVTYVPEYVKEQLRQEIKQDVMDEARKDNLIAPNAMPDWVTRFGLFGDFRFRYQDMRYPSGNDNTGAFPNFNAINTGAPIDVAGSTFSPQLNVDQNRSMFRLRARAGAAIDLGDNFSAGLRIATGNDDQPVSENQTIGAAGSAQGGDFSKYAIWLDRAFLKYELGGKPDEDLSITVGRFDNPFFSTSMIWADDLGFDGGVIQGKYHFGEDVSPFLTVGAFPVFNTDLNFASTQPAKFKSYDKYLYAAQFGVNLDLGKDWAAKFGVAYYKFVNIEGQLSDPFTPLTATDAGDTDDSRPSFAQFGNTYMPLRDIVLTPQTDLPTGIIDQFQYYGLASKFDELAFDGRLDFNQFEPFQISLTGEYVINRGFNQTAIAAVAVNNRGPSPDGNPADGQFLGTPKAWLVRMTLGDAVLQKLWDWNCNLGYRSVGSDSVVDGFADADFGGGGTNFKGPTLGGGLALSSDVWLKLTWMSASTVSGPQLKNDILQADINAKF